MTGKPRRRAPHRKPEDHLREIAEHIRAIMWELDPATAAVTYVNPAIKRMYGLSIEDVIEDPRRWLQLVHRDDRERLERLFRQCSTEPIAVEFRIVRPDGEQRWIRFNGDPVLRRDVALIVGICQDITELKAAEFERERSHSLLRATLDSTADGILVVDLSGHIASYNRIFIDLWHLTPEIAATQDDAQVIDSVSDQLADPALFLQKVHELYDHPEATSFDTLAFKDGRLYERYSRPQFLENRVVGRVWSFRDVTARRRAEAGIKFLSDASRMLTGSLDYSTTLHHLADLVVPTIADWFVVDLLEDSRSHHIVSRHADPRKQPVLQELFRRHPRDSADEFRNRIRQQTTELVPEVTDAWLMSRTQSPEELELWRELGIRSVVIAPLMARQRALGTMTVVSASRKFHREDATLVQDLATRAATALENALLYEESQLANKAKSDFLAVMSHELRTPLAAITGYADLIDAGIAGPVTEQQHGYIQRLQLQAQELLRIITEILTYSRTESERERIRIETFDLHELLNEVIGTMRPFAVDKGLQLVLDLSAAPATIESDPVRLRNILLNLISNAIKFTHEGRVDVSAAQEDRWLVVRVRDTGVGIAPDDHAKVFAPFFQVENAMTREKGGTGLGLAVALRLAHLLGGDIALESQQGVGSTFTLTLPARPASDRGQEHVSRERGA